MISHPPRASWGEYRAASPSSESGVSSGQFLLILATARDPFFITETQVTTLGVSWPQVLSSSFDNQRSMVCPEAKRRPLNVRSLVIDAFKSELSKFPFLSEEEKEYPPAPQTWKQLRAPKLRRYPTCERVLVEELLDDHGMEGFVLKVTVDGGAPSVLKVVRLSRYIWLNKLTWLSSSVQTSLPTPKPYI